MSEQRLELGQKQKLSQNLQTAIHLLSMDLDGLSEHMLKAVQENPALEYVPPVKSPQEYVLQVKSRFRASRARPDSDLPEDIASPVTALEDLEQQLRFAPLPEDVRRVAIAMLHHLSPRGYFTEDLSDFARDAGLPLPTVEAALHALQALEPVGIGARDVQECLTLQLRAMDNPDPLCYDLVKVHLLDIGKGNLRQISRETGATLAHVQACVDLIRTLNPIPCSLSEGATQYIMPEFSVETDERGELTILFHNDYFPTFRADDNFRRLAEGLTGEEQAYAKQMLSAADQLIRGADMRQSTMEKLARIIVREQRAFFLGQYNLLPLRCEDAAAEMGVHESTVYRALQGKYLYCARGTFPLNHFFQREMSGGASPERIREMIREMCSSGERISDQKIADALAQRGIQISRRTVAKYRSQMDIDSSFHRS